VAYRNKSVFIASNVNCQSGTARVCCCDATAAVERRAAIDRYFLPVGRSAAKPQQRRSNHGINQSINQSIFICSKCPEIHIKGFLIASRTTRPRSALTAAQVINYTMKEKEKLNAYKIAYGGVHIHLPGFI